VFGSQAETKTNHRRIRPWQAACSKTL